MKSEEKTPTTKAGTFIMQSLDDSLNLIATVVKSRGEVPCTLSDIALITGIGEGTLPLPLSTAQAYGVYQNNFGSGYKPTQEYHKIISPTFAEQGRKARYEALSRPVFYQKLLAEFNGKILPSEKGLGNHLIREYNIKPYAIAKIVKAFFENFREYIDSNNKLRFIYLDNQNNNDKIQEMNILPENTQEQTFLTEKILPIQAFSPISAEGYTVHIAGAGINSTLSLTDEDDFLILEAMLRKLKKKINNNGATERPD